MQGSIFFSGIWNKNKKYVASLTTGRLKRKSIVRRSCKTLLTQSKATYRKALSENVKVRGSRTLLKLCTALKYKNTKYNSSSDSIISRTYDSGLIYKKNARVRDSQRPLLYWSTAKSFKNWVQKRLIFAF